MLLRARTPERPATAADPASLDDLEARVASGSRIVLSSRLSAIIIVLFIVAPLILAGAGGWPGGRSFVAELSSSLGIAALGVLALLILLPTRLPVFEGVGAGVAVRLHRRLGSGFAALLLAHVVAVVVADPSRLRLFEVVGDPWRALAALAATAALGLLAVTSLA